MSSTFVDSLGQFGGTVLNTIGEVTSTVVNQKLMEWKAPTQNVSQPNKTIQPTLAQPDAAQPIKGINSNGETIAVDRNPQPESTMKSLLENKYVKYGGLGVLGVIGLAFAARLAKSK